MGVGSLGGEIDRCLPGGGIDVGHRPAGLQGRRMGAGVVGFEADHQVGLLEGTVGGVLAAGLPLVDQVVGLALLLVPDQDRPLLQRLLGVVMAGSSSYSTKTSEAASRAM
jgi:hypothetical protein